MIDTAIPVRWRIPLFFFVTLLLAVTGMRYVYRNNPTMLPIRGDGVGYYLFLPNYIIFHDLTLESVARTQFDGAYPDWTGIRRHEESGRYLEQYTVGEPLLMTPFFLAGHLFARILGQPQDGFSPAYQWAAAFSGTFYAFLGLYALRRLLGKWHDPGTVLATLFVITFGTNLFHYATRDSIVSHAYSFCMIALLCWISAAWHESPTLSRSIGLGVIMGLVVLVRQTNVISALIPALYGLRTPRELPARMRLLVSRWRSLALAVAVSLLVFSPQLAIWKEATGHWVINSYPGNLHFDFLHPKLFSLLFSVKKGLFFWSPALLFAVAGFALMRRQAGGMFWPALLLICAQTWIMASWVFWDYGGSYGHRGYTDWLPLFACPLAALFARLKPAPFRVLVYGAIGLTVLFSVFQMLQYWHGQIPSEGPTWEEYQKLFLTF